MNHDQSETQTDRTASESSQPRGPLRELRVRIHSRELWNDRRMAENLERTYQAFAVPN